MRLSVAIAVACLTIIGLSIADESRASIKKHTDIPAEGLGTALQKLAKDRNFQIIYVAEVVSTLRTAGAVGEFTPDEALKQLLKGTGLTYRYLDEKTVTIVPAASIAPPPSGEQSTSQNATSEDQATKPKPTADVSQSKRSLWDRIRLAQVDQGASSGTSSVENDKNQASKKTSDQIEEVVVTGRYEFLSADTSGTTNLPVPIEKVPQSISLVSADFIKAADLKTLGDIAQFTPGAIFTGNSLGFNTLIDLRGFGTAKAIDGIPVQGAQTYEPDYAVIDRLEVVRGPSSVVYGVAGPGGLVNYVTKSATPQTVDYVYAQLGSWDSYRLEGQVAGALDSAEHLRGIGVVTYDQGDSFQDVLNHATTTLYGGINANLGDSVTAFLHGGYQYAVRTAFDGIPTEADGSPPPVPRSFFIGNKSMEVRTTVYHAEGDVTWHANDMLDFTIKGMVERDSASGTTPYSQGLEPNGDLQLTIQRLHEYDNDNNGIAVSSIYRFDDLGLKKSFISFSALYQNSRQLLNWDYSNNLNSNIFDGEAALSQGFESLLAGPFNPYVIATKTQMLIVSVQSVLQLTDPLSVLLGASHTRPDETQFFNGSGGNFSIAGQTSYRAGLTYELLAGLNGYVSYSQSFVPQTAFAVGNTLLPPETGDQYEAGLKYRSANGRLLLTGAAFQINQKNAAEYDTTIGAVDYYKAVGEVTNKGVELSALGQLTQDWQINAAYSYLDPRVTKDTDTAILGQTQLFLPKQTASFFTTYTLSNGVLRGLSFGGGARYVASERTAYNDSTRDIAGYVVTDATLGYSINKWIVQLNGHNLFDRHYLVNTYQTLFYGNVVGTPFNVALSVRRDF
jgi:iron complex outermembrane receptor protein